jgi:NADPH:quinone reductase-like Zn-dependent oxidoreductase
MEALMQAIRVHDFGGLDSLVEEDVPEPAPGDGEVLLRVKAAGVGPWDALIRSGRSVLPQPLPLTLGSDVAGLVESVGPGVPQFKAGDAVFGATNARFTGGYAEYAVASATKLAKMPRQKSRFDETLTGVDVVLDTVGGDAQDLLFAVLKRGGVLVSIVTAPDQQKAAEHNVRALYFLVEVSSRLLEQIASLIEAGELVTRVGDVLPLSDARIAHEMLSGEPHKPGKIFLRVDGSTRASAADPESGHGSLFQFHESFARQAVSCVGLSILRPTEPPRRLS